MKAELLSNQKMDGEDEITVWTIKNGENEVCLNDFFESNIPQCNWIDEDHTFCQIDYSEWDDTELTAIFHSKGHLIKKGLFSIEKFIPDYSLFIVIISGFGVGVESIYYMMEESDSKWAVINASGEFVIPPNSESIKFDYKEQTFFIGKLKFSISGKAL